MSNFKTSLYNTARQTALAVVLVLLAGIIGTSCGATHAPHLPNTLTTPESTPLARYPFPQHVAYAPATSYPDLARQARDQIVRKVYDQWKQNYITPVNNPATNEMMYRVNKGRYRKEQTVSEGQGYGMIIVALMAGHDPEAKALFDGLWYFARSHPSRNDKRLMAYRVPTRRNRRNSAFDGDSDMAYGLLLAHRQWGDEGPIDYWKEALAVIEGLRASAIGPDSFLPMLGDWVNPQGRKYNQRTIRTSDIMPGHFRSFARATGNQSWLRTLAECQRLVAEIQSTVSPATGLLPDFIKAPSGKTPRPKPAPAYFLEGSRDGDYYYNAARVPWRIGTDALLNNDPASLAQVRKLAAWIVKASRGAPDQIKPGYTLDGRPISGHHFFSKAFVAPFGIAVMTLPDQQDFLNRTFDLVRGSPQGYYEDTLALLCLLVMTGNFWDPTMR